MQILLFIPVDSRTSLSFVSTTISISLLTNSITYFSKYQSQNTHNGKILLLFMGPCTSLQGIRPIKLWLQASSPSPSGDFSMGWMRYSWECFKQKHPGDQISRVSISLFTSSFTNALHQSDAKPRSVSILRVILHTLEQPS